MDIKKLQDIIDKSDLSPDAKDLIDSLIPNADKPEIQEEILKTIDYEVKMYGMAADEADQVLDQLKMAEREIDSADKLEDDALAEITAKYEQKMGQAETDMKQNLQYKDNLVKAISGQDSVPAQEPAQEPVQEMAPVVESPQPPVQQFAPAETAPVAPDAPVTNPGYFGTPFQQTPEQPAQAPMNPMGQPNQ